MAESEPAITTVALAKALSGSRPKVFEQVLAASSNWDASTWAEVLRNANYHCAGNWGCVILPRRELRPKRRDALDRACTRFARLLAAAPTRRVRTFRRKVTDLRLYADGRPIDLRFLDGFEQLSVVELWRASGVSGVEALGKLRRLRVFECPTFPWMQLEPTLPLESLRTDSLDAVNHLTEAEDVFLCRVEAPRIEIRVPKAQKLQVHACRFDELVLQTPSLRELDVTSDGPATIETTATRLSRCLVDSAVPDLGWLLDSRDTLRELEINVAARPNVTLLQQLASLERLELNHVADGESYEALRALPSLTSFVERRLPGA